MHVSLNNLKYMTGFHSFAETQAIRNTKVIAKIILFSAEVFIIPIFGAGDTLQQCNLIIISQSHIVHIHVHCPCRDV